MARIFTIRFSFEDIDYTALVTERVQPLATEYTFSMLDEELALLLAGSKVLQLPTGTLSFLKKEGLPGALMEHILQAIAHHVGAPA